MTDNNIGECKNLRKHLRQIEPGFDVHFDFDKEKYVITYNGSVFQSVPWDDIPRGLIDEIRHTVWLNRTGQIFDYCDKSQERVEASKDRALTLYAEAMASDIRRPLINNYLYGH